jgi:hypothetical protein
MDFWLTETHSLSEGGEGKERIVGRRTGILLYAARVGADGEPHTLRACGLRPTKTTSSSLTLESSSFFLLWFGRPPPPPSVPVAGDLSLWPTFHLSPSLHRLHLRRQRGLHPQTLRPSAPPLNPKIQHLFHRFHRGQPRRRWLRCTAFISGVGELIPPNPKEKTLTSPDTR